MLILLYLYFYKPFLALEKLFILHFVILIPYLYNCSLFLLLQLISFILNFFSLAFTKHNQPILKKKPLHYLLFYLLIFLPIVLLHALQSKQKALHWFFFYISFCLLIILVLFLLYLFLLFLCFSFFPNLF